MPVPEERMRRPDGMNRWFMVASVLMTVSFMWMIMVDYERPWRAFQDSYFVSKAAFAHLDYLDAVRQDRLDEIADAEKELEAKRTELALTGAVRQQELAAQLAHADLEFRKANAPFSKAQQVLEVTKDTYEKRLGEYGPDHAVTKAAFEQFDREKKEVEQLRIAKEQWEDKRKQIEIDLRQLEEPVRLAEKRVADLKQVAITAEEKDQNYRGVLTDAGLIGGLPIVKTIINFPLLDFTAPKNTPGRHQVNQLVLPEVRQRLNYLETYTTDRCTTCHVAIDDPEFSKDRLARKLERALPGISEAMQRMGEPAMEPPDPPVALGTGEKLPAGQVTEHWDEMTPEQRDAYFVALLAKVNTYLSKSGRKTIELGEPLLAHPDLELYVSVDSAHPMARVGCTVCHEGNPQETDFVQAAHSPPTHEIEREWEEKYYLYAAGVPNVTFETVAHYWDRPMRLPEYTEAGCAKCHSQVSDIAHFQGDRKGDRINLGQHLFLEVGCINCHNVEDLAGARRVGPDLTHVAHKLDPKFVEQWVWFPQSFRPSTRMPHFFMQENNDAESRNEFDTDPALRTQTEVAAITQYLFAVSQAVAVKNEKGEATDWKPIAPPDGVTGDAARGKEYFVSLGCTGCHANLAATGEQWITADLVHREKLAPDRAKAVYNAMALAERSHYAMEHFATQTDTIFDPESARFNPDREYNAPTFSRFAPELSGIGSKVTADWLYSWLIEPTHYAPDTKMPSLRLTPNEAADLTAYLMTLKNDEFEQKRFPMDTLAWEKADELIFELLAAQRSARRSRAIMDDQDQELTSMTASLLEKSLGKQPAYDLISGMSIEEKKLTFLGSKMIGHYGCYACHLIPGFEETTPPGTDLSVWAEKPITQLDFAFYDHAFHDMRHSQEEVYSYVYRPEDQMLNDLSPLPERSPEQITHTHAAFAQHKMLNPRIWDREKIKRPYDKLKMPNFYFDEEEAAALTTYLLSRIPPRVTDALKVDYDNDPRGPIAKGRTLTRELNCVGCHQIEDNAPMIQQYFLREIGGRLTFNVTNAPPLLWGEGAKVQHNWFHRFLQQVEPLRPWLQVRMPSFTLSDAEATTLVEYFAALARQDSQKLTESLAPVREYKTVAAQQAAGERTPSREEIVQAGADWYEQESLKKHAASLERFAVERKLVRPNDLNPLTSDAERLKKAHEQVFDRVSFLQSLYDVKYPFVEPPAQLSPQPRYELGASFLTDMGCLQCHVLGPMLPGPAKTTDQFVQTYRLDGVRGEGDKAVAILNGTPYPVGATVDGHTVVSAQNTFYESGDVETKAIVEGPSADGETERILLVAPSAPNLGLTSQRLQRRWVYDWMVNPQLIQPGTKMPQNFGGEKSPLEGNPKYPGTGQDHINLLVDYLFDAGTKNDRSPVPKLAAPKADEGFEEEEEFED